MRPSLLVVVLVLIACGAQPAAQPPTNRGAAASTRDTASPYDARTWIAKLDDPRETERAATELEQLGNPIAIPALGKAWLAQGRPVRLLQIIVGIARPLTAEEATATFVTDYEQTGRPASWDQALPFLVRATSEVDESDPRSVDNATNAAMALGEAKLGVEALASLALRPPSQKLISAQIAAIRALAAFEGNADARRVLVQIVSHPSPEHPRTATDRETRRTLETRMGLHLAMTGAAINALAQHADPSSARPLVLELFTSPELLDQLRRALVAVGPAAKAEIRDVLRGKHAQVNELFKAQQLDRYCGDRGDQPCRPVSAMAYYAAIVAGDFYDVALAPDLVGVLGQPAAPAYYIDDTAGGGTQHLAALDALAKIGAPSAAAPILALALDAKADVLTRAPALTAYPFLARDAKGAAALARIAADNRADDSLRTEAALALSRISTDRRDIAVFERLAKKYLDASAQQSKKGKQAAAKAYVGFARMFQTHIARIEIAIHGRGDASCLVDTLKMEPANVVSRNQQFIPDLASWTRDEKQSLLEAAIDRAMIELGKHGPSASMHTDALLAAVKTDRRLARAAILRALPQIAPLPCAVCVDKLEAAFKAGEGKPQLEGLNSETRILRHYFESTK